MERFYILRNKFRADGTDIDADAVKEVYSEKVGYSTFFDYVSKAFVDTTYPQINVTLLDKNYRQLAVKNVETSYVAPTTETTETESATE